MDPEYGHAYGNEPPSERGKFETGGYQPPQQYPVYHGHQQNEHVPYPTPPFPYPAPSGSSLPSAVYTTDHAHITRGDANPRYHKIKDFFKGRRHKHKDDHQEQEALPQLPDLSVALNDTQSLGRYPRMHVSTEPDVTPTMVGEMSSMKSHPHRRSINPTKKQHSPLSQGSPTTSSSSDEPPTPNRHSAFIEETNSKGSTHIQFIPHASGYDQQHIPQYNHRQHQSEPDYFQPQPEYGYQQHSDPQQWGYGQYRPSDDATPTGRRSSIDGGVTPSQRTYQSHFSHAPSHHTDRSGKSRKRSTSFSAAPPSADARSTNTIQPHTYVPAPNGAVAYAPSANTHRSGHSQQTALVNAPIPRDFASYNPSTSISSTSTHEGRSGRDSGLRSKMGMTRRRSNSHPPAIYASSQHSSRVPSHHSSQQAPSVHSSHRSTRQPDYGATRPVKEDDMKTDSDLLKSLHGTDFEEMMIAKGVLKVPSSGDDGYDYARPEKSTRGRRQSDAEKSHHGRVGLRERMGMTRKRSSSHPPSINTYPQAQATTNPSSSRTPYFNAFSSATAPPPAHASQIYQPSHNPSASASSHRTHSRHTSSPDNDYAKSTTTRGSIASTLKREHMGMTRRRSNSHPTPTTFSPSQLYNTPSSNPMGYTTSESKAYPPSAMAHNGSHRRRASVGMKPRFEIPTSKPMERGTIDWGDDLEESERRRGRGRDGAPEDRSKHARPPLTPPPHPKPFELREYKYGLREPVYQPI